ncbi:MAG TPA: rhodanese-like domain-containing protein [Chloroflexota bacterium]|nr:rhodanese-like domain-containing protein [Chloroflexota bacterium]
MSYLPQPKEIDAAEVNRRRADTVIVDVREDWEWDSGHIPGARHIPLGDLNAAAAELLALPEVIFVCHIGSRSGAAAVAFTNAGHPNALNLAGGMEAWESLGLPVEN